MAHALGRLGPEIEPALADERMLLGEACVELGHVDDEVGEDGDVRDRLDRDLATEIVDGGDAHQDLTSVRADAAGPARGV